MSSVAESAGRRLVIPVVAALATLGLAVVAAQASRSGIDPVTRGIERLSSTSATALSDLTSALPLSYAFAAGMVSATNPCGFALLPTYLGLFLKTEAGEASTARRVLRAVAVSGSMTMSFVVLFGLIGLLISVASFGVVGYFRWLGLAVGIALVMTGAAMLAGRSLGWALGERMAARVVPLALRGGVRGYAAYGLAYGVCSLSCTLPIFLVVVGSSMTMRGFGPAILQFVRYALGMGTVLTVLTVATALAGPLTLGRLRGLGRYLEPAGALLLLATGAYVVYYWLTVGGILEGSLPWH